MRKPLLLLLPFLLVFLVLGILGIAAVNQWVSGEGFHALLEQKSSEALRANASFGPLHWGWFEISSPHFHAEGKEGNSLREAEVGGMSGRLNASALLQGLLQVEEITLESARLHIDTSRHLKKPSLAVREQVAAVIPPTAAKLPTFLKGIPSMLVVELIRSKKTDLLIDLPSGVGSLNLQDTHLDAYPEGKETRIEARGGTLSSPFLPQLQVATIRCRIKPDLVDITGADLSFPSGGTLRLEGIFPDTKISSLSGHWEMVPVSALLPSLARQISGKLDGDATASWDLNGVDSVQGHIRANDTILTGIPLLEGVARLTGMEAFDHLYLQRAEASFTIGKEGSSWRNVELESKDLLKLTGDAEIGRGGTFAGTFRLGLSVPIVRAILGASQVFGQVEEGGYCWTTLKVGGTLSQLTEDLTPRITTAVLSNAGLLLQHGVKQGLQILGLGTSPAGQKPVTPDTNSQPSSIPPPDPAKALKDGAGAALDVLGGFLK